MFSRALSLSPAQNLCILLALNEVDAVRPEMVDEVLQDVHHVGGDVVEGDGQVAAAGESLLLLVELIHLVPVRKVAGDQVSLRNKRKEPFPPFLVPGVSGLHSELLHAQTHLHVLGPPGVLPTHVRIVSTIQDKSPESLLGENISGSATEVALVSERLELMTKEFGLVVIEVLKKISEVLHNHVGIVVRFKEPVILLVVMIVDVLEGVLGLVPQMVPALSDVELDCWQVLVLL